MYKKLIYYKDTAFNMEAEFIGKFSYVHLTVEKWSVSIAKKIYRVFKSFLEECRKSDIIAVYTISPNSKFCEMYSGTSIGFIEKDGKEYEVFKWDLKLLH